MAAAKAAELPYVAAAAHRDRRQVVAQVPGAAVPNHSLTGNRGTVGGKFGTESVVLNGGCDDRDFGDQIIYGGGVISLATSTRQLGRPADPPVLW
jgi:hypothetical protein